MNVTEPFFISVRVSEPTNRSSKKAFRRYLESALQDPRIELSRKDISGEITLTTLLSPEMGMISEKSFPFFQYPGATYSVGMETTTSTLPVQNEMMCGPSYPDRQTLLLLELAKAQEVGLYQKGQSLPIITFYRPTGYYLIIVSKVAADAARIANFALAGEKFQVSSLAPIDL